MQYGCLASLKFCAEAFADRRGCELFCKARGIKEMKALLHRPGQRWRHHLAAVVVAAGGSLPLVQCDLWPAVAMVCALAVHYQQDYEMVLLRQQHSVLLAAAAGAGGATACLTRGAAPPDIHGNEKQYDFHTRKD